MSPRARTRSLSTAGLRQVTTVAATIGGQLREERRRRRLTLANVADAAGLSRATVQLVEAGRPAMLETYVRIAHAVGRRLRLDLESERQPTVRAADPVHAAMGEAQAGHLQALGFIVRLDEPYQHYQFAGRADLVAWDLDRRALLHIENRTQFPNLQDAYGAFAAKRAYLPGVLADRLGIDGWASVTHVMAGLWSSEVLHVLRLRSASFRAACPDAGGRFVDWWSGNPPASGTSAIFVVFDPAAIGTRRRAFVELATALRHTVPRYRGYADAAETLSRGNRR